MYTHTNRNRNRHRHTDPNGAVSSPKVFIRVLVNSLHLRSSPRCGLRSAIPVGRGRIRRGRGPYQFGVLMIFALLNFVLQGARTSLVIHQEFLKAGEALAGHFQLLHEAWILGRVEVQERNARNVQPLVQVGVLAEDRNLYELDVRMALGQGADAGYDGLAGLAPGRVPQDRHHLVVLSGIVQNLLEVLEGSNVRYQFAASGFFRRGR
mmetsp:Transcript_1118/g.2384  ORF Transcript_1118/g.2384 Transcript_1118/m.2384 type:complete len:208 (-) Transcript_1118:712-1335(-)